MGSLHFPIAFGHEMHHKKFQLSKWSGRPSSVTPISPHCDVKGKYKQIHKVDITQPMIKTLKK